jgi:ribulose-phosphate 3-epimerase
MITIAPSILSANFSRLAEEVRAVEAAGADWIHADVMDGHFVPNITFGPPVVAAVCRVTSLPVDVHLMIENPDDYIDAFADAGAALISVQVEACTHLHRTIDHIRSRGVRAGAVLNPATPLASLEWVAGDLDYILIMSVNPGFGGQAFIAASLPKLRALRRMLTERGLSPMVEVDGGVNADTIADIAACGVDVFVAGSAIYNTPDYGQAIERLRQLAQEGRADKFEV